MNISYLPTTCLIMAACVIAMATCEEEKISLTNGKETVTWEHLPESSGKRHPNEGLNLKCKVSRGVASSSSDNHRVVSKSAGAFENDKRLCLQHERHKRQIMVGTMWCGNGDNAEHYDQLGYFSNIDKCCRAHDHCDRYVTTEATDYGVTNDTPYTWSDCKCDDDFRTCLHDVDSIMSYFVGKLFFEALPDSKCLEFDLKDPNKARAVAKGDYNERIYEPQEPEEPEEEKEEEDLSNSWWYWLR